jgi:hypothetical protein
MNKLLLSLLVILMPAVMASCAMNKTCPPKDEAATEETTEVQSQEMETETPAEATAEAAPEAHAAGH